MPELELPDSFLRSDAAHPESIGVADLDGFLTSIACGPEKNPSQRMVGCRAGRRGWLLNDQTNGAGRRSCSKPSDGRTQLLAPILLRSYQNPELWMMEGVRCRKAHQQ